MLTKAQKTKNLINLKFLRQINSQTAYFIGLAFFLLVSIYWLLYAQAAPAGTLTVSFAETSPELSNDSLMIGNQSWKNVASFKLQADSFEALDIDQITLTDLGDGTTVSTYYLFNVGEAGEPIGSSDPITSAAPIANKVTFILPDDTLNIPANGEIYLNIRVDSTTIGAPAANDDYLQVAVNTGADITATGKTSSATINATADSFPVSGHKIYIFQSYLHVQADRYNLGSYVFPPGFNKLAVFEILVIGEDNLIFSNANGNSLTVKLSGNCWPGNVSTPGDLILQDAVSATIYDTIPNVDFCQFGYYTFDFSDNAMVLAGDSISNRLNIMGNVIGPSALQVSLDGTNPNNINWGINLAGNYQHAEIILNSDEGINGPVLSYSVPPLPVRPVFKFNAATPSSSPSGIKYPSDYNQVLGIIDVTAQGDNITFIGGDGNYITLALGAQCLHVGVRGDLFLTDGAGFIYDVINNTSLCMDGPHSFDFSVNDLIIPEDTTKTLYIIGDTISFADNDRLGIQLRDDMDTWLNWSINSDGGNYGYSNLIYVDPATSNDIFGPTVVYAGPGATIEPAFSLDALSPGPGPAAPGVETKLAIFKVDAIGDTITFDGVNGANLDAGNSLTVNIQSGCNPGGGTPGDLILRNEDSLAILDVINGVNLCQSGNYTFDFSNQDLTITSTARLGIYANTINVGATYVSLNGLNNNNVNWSIDYDGGNYTYAMLIFNVTIWGNVLIFNDFTETTNPTVSISAPVKQGAGSVGPVYIYADDNWALSQAGLDLSNSTANTSNFQCYNNGPASVYCSVDITSSGNLVVDVTDTSGNTSMAIEYGFIITQLGGSTAAPASSTDEESTGTQEEPAPEEQELQKPALAPGMLVKSANSSTLYFVGGDNKRHPFPDLNTYTSWFSYFTGIEVISDEDLALIPIGANVLIRPGTYLVKLQTSPKVYAIESPNILRWIETADIAENLYGTNWEEKLIDLPDALFEDYQVGAAITELTHPSGSLIQYTGESAIYYIEQSKKMLVNDSVMAENFFQEKFLIINVPASLNYEDGGEMPATPLTNLIVF